MKITLPAIALLLTLGFVNAQEAQPSRASNRFSASSYLEFKTVNGKQHTITRNQKFSIFSACPGECAEYVLHETYSRDEEEGVEGGVYEVQAKAWTKENPAKALWMIKSGGEEGSIWYDFYKVTQPGISAGPDDRIYFSLRTGKKVYLSTSDEKDDLAKIEVPNARTARYIAYGDPNPVSKRGLLQYGDAESVHQKIIVHEPVLGRPPKVALRLRGQQDSSYAQLWQHNGDTSSNAVSGVEVVLKFEDQGEVVIPVENDRLAISKARLPKGFRLTD